MERDCEGGEIEKKLRRSLLLGNSYYNRAPPSTPPPTWRLGLPPPSRVGTKEFLGNSEVSVRKLCAELWESEQFRPPAELRRCRRRDSDMESPCGSRLQDHQPRSRGGSLRRQPATTNDHINVDFSQPNSPASCSSSSRSSVEVVTRKPAFSQTGSSLVKSASYGLGSSTKLLKVLNRIWTLEEQNAANMSLVKALKMELDECRAEIKEVQHREKQSNRRRIWKRTEEEEEEEIKDVFRSMKKELGDEKEVRRKSESIHRKLTQELCEAKHCLRKALRDLEKERKERIVVESLCNEFAKTIDFRSNRDGSASMHQSNCLKELERRTRRDNKLHLKKCNGEVYNMSMSSEGDRIYPESSPGDVDDHQTLAKIVPRNVNVRMVREENRPSLKEKLMEARVESRRLRSLKPE